MFKPFVPALSLATAAALLSAPALSADGGSRLDTRLSGATEVPGPGDTDGSGTAGVSVNSDQNQICYTLSVSGIEPATMAHIHRGAAGAAGPVMISLRAPIAGSSKGCVTVNRELALAILKSPANYYVHVHNAPFPGGAIRGQFAK